MDPSNVALVRARRGRDFSRSGDDLVLLALVLAPFIGVTFLAKFAIPPFGGLGIAIGVLVNLVAMTWAFAKGIARINLTGLSSVLLFTGYAAIVSIARNGAYSVSSLLFFLFIHLPYAVVLPTCEATRRRICSFYINTALSFAILGILQYVVQFAAGSDIAFPIENFVPETFQVHAFNKQGVIGYGMDVYRANGVFMVEPSFYSQLLAVAVVLEIVLGRGRPVAILLMMAGILLSYSGTGLVILAACLPFIIFHHWKSWMWMILPGGVSLLLIAAQFVDLSLIFSRAGEFDQTGSSGFARFVGGFYFFDQFLWDSPAASLFGMGAGQFKNYALNASLPVAEMTLTKMVFEFGLLGAAAYFLSIFRSLSQSAVPRVVTIAVFVTFFLNGVYVGFAHGLALALLVWPRGSGRN